jgi:hypothetical protein
MPQDLNARTHVALGWFERRPLGPRASFLVAHERLALLAGVADGAAVVVAAIDSSAQVVASLLVRDRQALIVGRHTQCGLRLDAAAISLRHLAALVRHEGERPVIHLRDLASAHPFTTEDGQPTAAVISDGPLYAAVGEYAFWFIPAAALRANPTLVARGAPAPKPPVRPDQAWRALAPRTFLERRAAGLGPRPAASPSPRADVSISHVTHVAPPLLLDAGDSPEIAWGVLRLEAGARRERRWVSAERLEQGILLGRYDRCSVMLATPGNTTSRVHALLMRLGAEVWIIDTASTGGIQRGDALVTAEVLRDVDRLSLGREVMLEWERIQHPEA